MFADKKKMMSLRIFLTASLLVMLCAAGMAQAQSQDGQKGQAEVTDKEAKMFAQAYSAIRGIQKEYSKEVQGVEDDSQIKKLQQKYTDKMMKKVKSSGLSIKRYNEIAQSMQQDKDLQDKVKKHMQSMQ